MLFTANEWPGSTSNKSLWDGERIQYAIITISPREWYTTQMRRETGSQRESHRQRQTDTERQREK